MPTFLRHAGVRWLLILAAALFSAFARADAQVGQPLPMVDTTLIEGKVLKASELKGKAVLTVFWATWCPICQREMPHVQKLYESLRGRGLEVLALSLDQDKFAVEQYVKDADFSFPVAMRAPAHQEAYGRIPGTPTFVLTDANGVTRLRHVGALPMAQLEAAIKPLLPVGK